MEFIDDDFCKDTPLRDFNCTLCGKKLAYIDSPFGPIPSLGLILKFFEFSKGFFEEQKKDLEKFSKSEIVDASKEKQELFNNFLTESQKRFNALDKELASKLTKIDTSVKDKVKLIQDKEDVLNYFVNQIYISFSEALSFFAELIEKVASLTDDFNISKTQFSEKITPQLNQFVNSLKILQNVIPSETTEIYSVGLQQTNINDVFDINKKFASKDEYLIRKQLFDEKWEHLSISLKSRSKEIK
ncbi:hypothetical protein LCGC14_0640570 [marine sediment metagenome]|uniref:Uncharacterized protein n=1 Tax=marine sediment metagenome TaxID=412755 RepID=A0A0F9QZ80_9ZZZZ|nr:hypothetical protein [bacterium]